MKTSGASTTNITMNGTWRYPRRHEDKFVKHHRLLKEVERRVGWFRFPDLRFRRPVAHQMSSCSKFRVVAAITFCMLYHYHTFCLGCGKNCEHP